MPPSRPREDLVQFLAILLRGGDPAHGFGVLTDLLRTGGTRDDAADAGLRGQPGESQLKLADVPFFGELAEAAKLLPVGVVYEVGAGVAQS